MITKLSGKEIATIRALHAKGKSGREIARAIGRSRSGVWGQLQKIKHPKK